LGNPYEGNRMDQGGMHGGVLCDHAGG